MFIAIKLSQFLGLLRGIWNFYLKNSNANTPSFHAKLLAMSWGILFVKHCSGKWRQHDHS